MSHHELLRHYTVIGGRRCCDPVAAETTWLPLSLRVLHATTMPSSIVTYRLKRPKKALAAVVAVPMVITATKPGARKSKSKGVLRSHPIWPRLALLW